MIKKSASLNNSNEHKVIGGSPRSMLKKKTSKSIEKRDKLALDEKRLNTIIES